MKDSFITRIISSMDSEDQAHFINQWARDMYMNCRGRYGKKDSFGGYENQCCMIVKDLNKDGDAFIKELYEFIKLKQEDI